METSTQESMSMECQKDTANTLGTMEVLIKDI